MTFLPFIIRRALRHWQVLIPLVFGVILTTGLLASGPVLVDAVMDLAIFYKLRSADSLNRDIRLTLYDQLSSDEYHELDGKVRNAIDSNLGNYHQKVISTGGSNWAYPWVDEQLLDDQRINLRFYEGIEGQVTLISGDFPTGNNLQKDTIQGVIGENLSAAYVLKTGDRLPLSHQQNESEPSFYLEITGIIRPINSQKPYWFGEYNPLLQTNNQRWTAQYSAIIPQDRFFEITSQLFPSARSELNWNVLSRIDAIHPQDGSILNSRLDSLRSDLKSFDQKILIETNLAEILTRFQIQAEIVRAPLYLLIIEVLFLTLYYVMMVSALYARQVESEFTNMSSRGASRSQIFRIQTTEAVLIGMVALLSGPFLANLLVWGLTKFGPLSDVSLNEWVTRLPHMSWIVAIIGALACILGLLTPLGKSLDQSVVAHQRSVGRSEGKPWWQRYYADVFLVVIGLILLWRLNLYGGVVVSSMTGNQVDWLLLLSPLILLIGAATILLRGFPLLLTASSRLISRSRGLSAQLAMWYISRDPTHVTRLVLLLTLAMALGILSTGLNATLDLSAYERALYAAGSDLRLVFEGSMDLAAIQATSGVQNASGVWRGDGMVNVRTYRSFPTFDLLAIEPMAFSSVTRYRRDYADTPMGEVLGQLLIDPGSYPVRTIPLPGRPTEIGLWLYDANLENSLARPLDYLSLKAKLQSSKGNVVTIDLLPALYEIQEPVLNGEDLLPTEGIPMFLPLVSLNYTQDSPSWRYFTAVIPHISADSYPLSLHSLWFKVRPLTGGNNWRDQTRQFLFILDDLTVVTESDREAFVFEDFEDDFSIWQTNNPNAIAQYNKRRGIDHSGEASLYIFSPVDLTPSGLAISPAQSITQKPLPVLASEGFLQTTELQVGDELLASVSGIATHFMIKDVIRYFPTMFEQGDQGFLVTALQPWLTLLNQTTSRPMNYNEVWITTLNPSSAQGLAQSFSTAIHSFDMDSIRRTIKVDPLSLGLRSVTFLGYILTVILSLVGFVTYFYMSARQRGTTYSVLMSMGLSRPQLYGSLVLEQIILICIGLTLGTLLGFLLNKMILPGVPISLGDQAPIPPFIPQENWEAVRRMYMILIGAFLMTLGAATLLLWRARIHRVMRIGQE